MKQSALGGIGHAFSDPNFRTYSVGAIATWIGFFVQLVAVSWHAWELTQSTTWLAAIALMDILPNIVLSPLAGVIADRFDKYRLMGIISCLALIQAVMLTIVGFSGHLEIWSLAALAFAHGVIISFMVPAMYGILPRFVAKRTLTSAIAVSSSYAQLAVFIGPIIAGWVISVYGVVWAFAINALGYLIYLISWRFLKTPPDFVHPVPSGQSISSDFIAGLRYVQNHKEISSILALLLVGDALGASLFYLAPAFAEQILGMGVVGVSMIFAAKGIGATLSAVYIAYLGKVAATYHRMLWSFLLFVLSVFLIFLSPNIYLVVLAFLLLGVGSESYQTIMTALVQLTVTEEQRGRVMATMFMFGQLASGIGTYLIGYYAASHGLIGPTVVAATICLLVWLLYFLRRKLLAQTDSSR
ncbi:MAG: MFS transporter [Acidiferrobacterales bacterium]|nr:MFS transporter [Acidiferrobacterales bacterium]